MIEILLSALVISSGALLLSKIHKYQLTGFYKWLAYLVILIGFVGIGLGISHMVCKARCEAGGCSKNEQCLMTGQERNESMKKNCCSMPCGNEAGKKDSVITDGNEIGDHQEKGQIK